MYVTLSRGHFWSVDEVATYHQARSLWERGTMEVAQSHITLQGPHGRQYTAIGVGQSVLAIPLYVVGKDVRVALQSSGAAIAIRALAGPFLGPPERPFGGDVEIFFVCLLNCFVVAAICLFFFLLSTRMGAPPLYAGVSAVLLGTTSYIAGFSTNFFQHAAETLFLLIAFYFLYVDSRSPDTQTRLFAGLAACVMPVIRVTSLLALPALSAYLLWTIWRRRDPSARAGRVFLRLLTESLPFAVPVAAGLAAVAVANDLKFGKLSLAGGYSQFQEFHSSLLSGLYAYVFSPGGSIFLFTPLLLLAPWFFRRYLRDHTAEALLTFGIVLPYVILHAKATGWHAQWSFGIRYLVPLFPLLLLPLAAWLPTVRPAAWLAIGPLALCGLLVQLLHFAVNVSYVYDHEHYPQFQPAYGYMFLPQFSQIPAHWRALMAWDYRVDLWLVNIFRQLGWGPFLAAAIPLFAWLAFSGWRLIRALRLCGAVEK